MSQQKPGYFHLTDVLRYFPPRITSPTNVHGGNTFLLQSKSCSFLLRPLWTSNLMEVDETRQSPKSLLKFRAVRESKGRGKLNTVLSDRAMLRAPLSPPCFMAHGKAAGCWEQTNSANEASGSTSSLSGGLLYPGRSSKRCKEHSCCREACRLPPPGTQLY